MKRIPFYYFLPLLCLETVITLGAAFFFTLPAIAIKYCQHLWVKFEVDGNDQEQDECDDKDLLATSNGEGL